MYDHKRVGQLLEQFRTEHGWSVRRAAAKANLSGSYLGELERGEREAGEGALLKITWRWQLASTQQRELFDAAGLDDLPTRELPPDLLTNMRALEGESTARLQMIEDAAAAVRLRRKGLLRDRRKPDPDPQPDPVSDHSME